MAKVKFKFSLNPQGVDLDVDSNTKILSAAIRAKVPIRFGCAACRCGTCGVKVSVQNDTNTAATGELSAMAADEKGLLGRMSLPLDGTVRLACRTRLMKGEVVVDLDFQETYSPDQGDDDLQDKVPHG